jgi:hypothetical protein
MSQADMPDQIHRRAGADILPNGSPVNQKNPAGVDHATFAGRAAFALPGADWRCG